MSDNTELIAEARAVELPPTEAPDYGDQYRRLIYQLRVALESSTVQLSAAQAVIAGAFSALNQHWSEIRGDSEMSSFDIAEYRTDRALEVLNGHLAQSPVDALAAHDRQVAAKALEEIAESYVRVHAVDRATSRVYNWLRARAAVYRSTVKGEGN